MQQQKKTHFPVHESEVELLAIRIRMLKLIDNFKYILKMFGIKLLLFQKALFLFVGSLVPLLWTAFQHALIKLQTYSNLGIVDIFVANLYL